MSADGDTMVIVTADHGEELFDHGSFNPNIFVFDRESRRSLVAEALAEDKSLWALATAHDILDIGEAVPAPAGHAWEIVTRGPGPGGLARLVLK